jgi:hypothetical protein
MMDAETALLCHRLGLAFCTTLNCVNPVLYPSIDTILCVLLTMPVASATAENLVSKNCFYSCVRIFHTNKSMHVRGVAEA